MKLNVLKMHPDVKLPTYATDGSGCFDIYSNDLLNTDDYTELHSTGLKFEIPDGYVMLVFSRSGHGFKLATRLANCVGVIDSDYRGELMVKLTCDDDTMYGSVFQAGDRIAQAMLVPIPKVVFNEVTELSNTARGEGGFGSTN